MSVQTEMLIHYAQAWRDAGHGGKGHVIENACRALGLAPATVHRKFNQLLVTPSRKRRADAGTTSLTYEEAKAIVAVVMEHMRKNGKRLKRFSSAIEECRALDLIRAERVHATTGEVTCLSTSAIVSALRKYRMHPDQLLRPAPAVRMRSNHPNHVWQIDASRCVMYWLPASGADNGLRIQDEKQFYKNKPANQIKAIRESIWRYNVTDHKSGWIFTDYVTGGESAENIITCFINSMIERPGEAMHGVPYVVMMDLGSANTSAPFMNLLKALQIRDLTNKPGNPRAKGQVEKSQDIVEREFESMLKTLPLDEVRTLEQIRAQAAKWRRYYNGTMTMRRHGMTRDSAWLHITSDQLIVAPPAELMREVSNSAPESRVVSDFMTVSFLGQEYDVSHVPGIQNGEKLLICRNVMNQDSALAIVDGVDGHDEFHPLPQVLRDEFGQVQGAPTIGESYASHAQTPAQKAAEEVELVAMDATTLEEAQAKRKAKVAFMGGRYDPFVLLDQTPVPTPAPRAGTAHEMSVRASQLVLPPLTHIQAVKQLRPKFEHWNPRYYQWVVDHYPDGVPADGVDAIEAELRRAMTPRVLPITRVA